MAERPLYHYKPSIPAAAIFAALFSITTILHIFISLRRRAWFMIPFLIGGIFEIIGYISRIVSSNDLRARNPFVIQTLLILLAPAFMAASIYMVLGRLIVLTSGEKFALVRRTWLTKIFVGGDVLSIVFQGIGGGMITSNKGSASTVSTGRNVIILGLWVQIVFFGFFVIVAVLFQFKGRHHFSKIPAELPWKKHLYILYVTSALILVRSLFRVIEYTQGVEGYLYTHEIFLYIFDAALMFAAMVVMNIVHPSEIAGLLKVKERAGGFGFGEMHTMDDSTYLGREEQRQ